MQLALNQATDVKARHIVSSGKLVQYYGVSARADCVSQRHDETPPAEAGDFFGDGPVDVGGAEAESGDEAAGDDDVDGLTEEPGGDGGRDNPEDACADAEEESEQDGQTEDLGTDANQVLEHELLAHEEPTGEGGQGQGDGGGEHEHGHHDAGVPEAFGGDVQDLVDIPGEGPAAGEEDEAGGAEDGEHGGHDLGDAFVVVPGVGLDDVAAEAAGEDDRNEGGEHHDRIEHGEQAVFLGRDALEEVLLQPDEHGDAQHACDQRTRRVDEHQPLADLDAGRLFSLIRRHFAAGLFGQSVS